MMLCYKAWRESRSRFLVAAAAVALYCFIVTARARTEFPVPDYPMLSYSGFVWANVYGNGAPAIFSVISLLLGLGGLQRERAYGTAPFTLALPVSRFQFVSSRALVGLLEIAVLALIPTVLLPTLSRVLVHQPYSIATPLGVSVLFLSWGAIWFATGLLLSTVLTGEYAASVAGVLTPFVYTIVYSRVSDGGRRFLSANPFWFMSGVAQMRPNSGVFVEPLPWVAITVLITISAALLAVAIGITNRESF